MILPGQLSLNIKETRETEQGEILSKVKGRTDRMGWQAKVP